MLGAWQSHTLLHFADTIHSSAGMSRVLYGGNQPASYDVCDAGTANKELCMY